jgi:tetratricopeptide (TPR) repeat protein
MARLDRLGQATKEIAQIAAAIGREFPYELLAPVAERGEADLQQGLGRLGEAGLIFSRGAPPHASYIFKHALVRDAAYGSLLRRRREALHTRIAAVLEAEFADRVAAAPELLARHLTEAGFLEKAVSYWQRAGERATQRSANREGIAHLKRGIEVLGRLPESAGRDEQELLLQAALIAPSGAKEGFAAAGAMKAATRAVELGRRIGAHSRARSEVILAHAALARFHMWRAELHTALAFAEEALRLAEHLGDPRLLSQAHYVIGVVHYHLAGMAAAHRHLENGLALYDANRDRVTAARLGFDTGTACYALLGLVLWDRGYPDEALRHAEQAIAAARAASHPLSEVVALSHAAYVHCWRGEIALCLERAEAALALAIEQMLPHYAAACFGWALVKKGYAEKGLARLRAAMDADPATGTRLASSYWLALLAEACLETGRIEEGLSSVREARALVEEAAARNYEAEINRLEGELLLVAKEPDETRAEASFRNAIAIARALQAKSWELRAAASVARLLARQGRHAEALLLLTPIYAWFTEGFDTANLTAAKVLLDSLQRSGPPRTTGYPTA